MKQQQPKVKLFLHYSGSSIFAYQRKRTESLRIQVQGTRAGAWRQGDVCVIKVSHLGLHSKSQISQSYKNLSQKKKNKQKIEKERKERGGGEPINLLHIFYSPLKVSPDKTKMHKDKTTIPVADGGRLHLPKENSEAGGYTLSLGLQHFPPIGHFQHPSP